MTWKRKNQRAILQPSNVANFLLSNDRRQIVGMFSKILKQEIPFEWANDSFDPDHPH